MSLLEEIRELLGKPGTYFKEKRKPLRTADTFYDHVIFYAAPATPQDLRAYMDSLTNGRTANEMRYPDGKGERFSPGLILFEDDCPDTVWTKTSRIVTKDRELFGKHGFDKHGVFTVENSTTISRLYAEILVFQTPHQAHDAAGLKS